MNYTNPNPDVVLPAKAYNREKITNVVLSIFFGIFIIHAIKYQFVLANYFGWGDEAETIVTAKMIAAGGSLFSTIFNHHGPLTFLPGVIVEMFGSFNVRGHRVPIAILQALTIAAIYYCPMIQDNTVRKVYSSFAIAVMLFFLPELYGHTYVFQVMAGLFIAIILVQYTFPAIACPERLSKPQIILGNFLIACLPFLAVTFIPIAGLLFFCSLRKQYLRASMIGLSAGIAFNLLFLLSVGSLAGFFAFHFYLNLKVLPLLDFGQGSFPVVVLLQRVFEGLINEFDSFAIFVCVAIGIAKLSYQEKALPWRSILLGVAISSLLVRGLGFQGLPYYYAALAFPILFFQDIRKVNLTASLILITAFIVCLLKFHMYFQSDEVRMRLKQIPTTTEFGELAKKVTKPEDKIIAYSFHNHEYIAAQRLPASGNFFYLPAQAKYNENPVLGIKIDTCEDIKTTKPKLMLIDKANYANRFPWESYAGCVQNILSSDYTQIAGRPYYLRNDIKLSQVASASPAVAHQGDSFYLTDGNWTRGIALAWAGFFLPNSDKNAETYKVGKFVRFANGDTREITRADRSGAYLNVFVTGAFLNADKVGLPSSFLIVDTPTPAAKSGAK